ncbi:helix-turn-helix domain-containing protein [Streptomyces sp. NPDC087525]|uniref:helix-turn-helix domain-containing protein n=1 Tax=Streptomyces sp. NPDC087525 TaxID=3365793 RepID=UPI00381E90CD
MNTRIPPHGSEGRYKGTRSGSRPPCRCQVCIRGNRLANIRRERARTSGQGNLVDCTVINEHLDRLKESGMSQMTIARQAGVSQTTISYIVNGKTRACQRDKAQRILAVTPGSFDLLSEMPMLAIQRKLQALYALGHGQLAIAAAGSLNHSTVSHIVNGRYSKIDGSTAAKAEAAYTKLSNTPGASWKAKARARKFQWAPPAAWDDDSFDDPNAHPDWTGHCGSDRGWWSHRLTGIPVCPPCDTAHTQWKADHRHLPHSDFMSAMGHARAAASNRGQSIAADGRELLGHGCDIDVAAARIGVTRQHLQQELIRHPELAEQGLAA